MVLECSLEHKAHIPSPDLGGGQCSTAGWDLWDADGEAPWSPFCAGAEWGWGLPKDGWGSCWGWQQGRGSAEGARDEVFISAD